jgi:hypothetical protein
MKVVSDESFISFERKLIDYKNLNNKSCESQLIDAISYESKIDRIRLRNIHTVELKFINESARSDLTINLHITEINFKLVLNKNNRCYHICHSYKHNGFDADTSTLEKNNVCALGFTIGDLLKHYYNNGYDKKQNISENTELSNSIHKFMKKAIKMDTVNDDITNVLGAYDHKKKTIYLWNDLPQKHNFDKFCKQMLFFSDEITDDLTSYSKNARTHSFTIKNFTNVLNNLSNIVIINKLFKYYLYGENPELANINTETCYYEQPKLVSDILMEFYEKTNDDEYMYLYKLIMKKINKHQQDTLKTKYPVTIVKSIASITDYPFYAFRNIYVERWTNGGINDDKFNIRYAYDTYMECVKNQKYKYKVSKSDKRVPLLIHDYRPKKKKQYKTRQLELKNKMWSED